MSRPLAPNPADREEIPWDFEGTRRHHIRLGLQMTPAERLRWLEDTVKEMRQFQGLARKSRPPSAGRFKKEIIEEVSRQIGGTAHGKKPENS